MKGKYNECGPAFSRLGLFNFKTIRAIHFRQSGCASITTGELSGRKTRTSRPCFSNSEKRVEAEGISIREFAGWPMPFAGASRPFMINWGAVTRGFFKNTPMSKKVEKSACPHARVYVKGPGIILQGQPQKNYLTEILFAAAKLKSRHIVKNFPVYRCPQARQCCRTTSRRTFRRVRTAESQLQVGCPARSPPRLYMKM